MTVIKLLRSSLFIAFLFLCSASHAQNKHALIIAIGDYKFWKDISSINDVPYIKNALLKQDFPEANISIVSDAKATMAGLDNAFKNLISKVKPGDIVFIHVSSHGEQIQDNNQEEIDGMDESIVTWDAAKPGSGGGYAKEQFKYFRDDQFGKYISELRARLGKNGDVLVVMDACHSGSGTRGSNKVRGGEKPLVDTNFKAPVKGNKNTPNVFLESNNAAGNQPLASFVLISGALAEELNTESRYPDGKEGGSLSIAVSKVFENLQPGTTYRSLFASILTILNEIVPDQHPVIEGDGIDRELFGGKFVDQKPFVEIEEINGQSLILKGGVLMGLDSGAKVALYPSGTTDPANETPLATGIITVAEPYRSEALLSKTVNLDGPAAGWVFVTEPFYKMKPLVLGMKTITRGGNEPGFSAAENEAMRRSLSATPSVKFDGEPELMLVKGPQQDSLKIAGNGYLFGTVNSNDGAELKEQLQRYSRYRLLMGLTIKDPAIDVEVKLVPVINGKPDMAAIARKTINGVLELNVGDKVVVWARNKSDMPVYINLLDIQPDGVINPILPVSSIDKPINPSDLKLEAGEEKIYNSYVITIGPPLGMEVFKVFASASMIDMERIALRKPKTRAVLPPLENLVDQSYEPATRSGISAGKPNGTVSSLLFRIKPGGR